MQIIIKSLKKAYNGKTVLDINEMHIDNGCFLGIIGPNGAGKSTLARIIAGLDLPSSGTIQYDGLPLDTGIYQSMTMVFQKPYLIRTSVFNNIAYPLKIRGFLRHIIEAKVNDILDEMEIQHIKKQNAWTLSGGEAQKVALARAIIFEPSLIILDEPTASIDPSSMYIMEKTIRSYYLKKKAMVIMITHNLQQAKRLCNEVAFMHQGQILEQGKTEDLIMSSKNPITKKFVEGEIIL